MTEGVEVRLADWETEEALVRGIRTRVFVREQDVPPEIEWDGRDADAVQLLALDHRGDAIGTARLLPDGQIGRMAVLPERRGFGIGRALLDAAVAAARERGDYAVWLNAQTHAEPFYAAAGFRPVGATFDEAGIPHQRMEREIGIEFAPPPEAPGEIVNPAADREDYDRPALAECTDAVRMLEGEGEVRDAIVELCAHARRDVRIFSQELDPKLFDDAGLLEALSRFARRHQHARVTILVHDSRRMVRDGHRMLDLVRRLSSSMSIRLVHPDLRDRDDTFVVADGTGVVSIPRHDTPAGFTNLNDRPLAGQFAKVFDRLHERSVHDPYLRTMNL
jgi:predicted GNAT family N-acyltransferase